MSEEQREDARNVFANIPNGGLLDYVAAWYVKALSFIYANRSINVAFVSTNSIAQGEQVAALWLPLLQGGAKIYFAHRTFQWSNEGKGNAAVHCVIIGFGLNNPECCTIYDHSADIKDDGQVLIVKRINPYLVDAPDVVLSNRRTPLCTVPGIGIGNKPIDGGNYLFTEAERDNFLAIEPKASGFFRPWIGSEEFINGFNRWCLWLGDASPQQLRSMPECMKRIDAVRKFRLASSSAPTQKLADSPTRFHVEFLPETRYLLVPGVSSERREFIPIGFITANVMASNLVLTIPNATTYHFSILNSTMHNAWMRAVCGRLESRYRYSATIVYNNFPWPEPTEAQQALLETTGQGILDARLQHPDASLADLYDPLTMPAMLRKAHEVNDRAADAAYKYKGDRTDAARVAFLFERYQRLTSLLPTEKPKRRGILKATKITVVE